jgi:hypothetical protein
VLDVVARCTGGPTSVFAGDPQLTPFTTDVRDAHDAPLPRDGARWTLPSKDDVTIRYRVDLDAAAKVLRDVDTALAVGRSLVAPLASYVLAPEPRIGSALVTVHPTTGTEFVTELEKTGSDFSLGLHEVRDSTYGVFGQFERTVVELPGAHGPTRFDVVSLDGRFATPRAEREEWVRKRAEAVAAYYGGFPVRRAGVVLTPIEGSGVRFGKVLSAGGSTIALFVGSSATPAELAADWVLVHEMFHIGFPSFVGEGKWLDEGLATYVEPLIRARAGMLTEEEGWAEVVRDMDLGVRLCESTGLEHPGGDYRSIYWGGAVIALLADVEARRRTNDATGLEDALRKGVARGWDASHVLPLSEAMRAIDDTLGSGILTGLAARYADHGNPLRLDPVLADLGVERREMGVRLHDDAPLAAVRRAIMYGRGAPGPDLGVRRRP